jgi:DUF2075 family protein
MLNEKKREATHLSSPGEKDGRNSIVKFFDRQQQVKNKKIKNVYNIHLIHGCIHLHIYFYSLFDTETLKFTDTSFYQIHSTVGKLGL